MKLKYPKKPTLLKEVNYKDYQHANLYLSRFITEDVPVLIIALNESNIIAICNINPEEYYLNDFEFVIKDYSENEGMMEWLVANNLMEPPHGLYPSGWVAMPVCYATQELETLILKSLMAEIEQKAVTDYIKGDKP